MHSEDDNWMPMESNPQVMNNYVEKLGFNTAKYSIYDMLSPEDWAQDMIPKPVQGVILLYQTTEPQKKFFDEQKKTLKAEDNSKKLFYMKQLANNACGSIALFHVILNSHDEFPDIFQEGSYLANFKKKQEQSPEDIGKDFKSSNQLKTVHKTAVVEGETTVVDNNDSHFISFIQKQGHLYELDGCKDMPVNHGPCTNEQLMHRACEEIQKFIARDPDNLNFSLLAIAKKAEE